MLQKDYRDHDWRFPDGVISAYSKALYAGTCLEWFYIRYYYDDDDCIIFMTVHKIYAHTGTIAIRRVFS